MRHTHTPLLLKGVCVSVSPAMEVTFTAEMAKAFEHAFAEEGI
jgi:hypothetical protein